MFDAFFYWVAGTSLLFTAVLFAYMGKAFGLGLEKKGNNPEYICRRLTEIPAVTFNRSMWLDGMFIGAYCTFFGTMGLYPLLKGLGSGACMCAIASLVSLVALTVIDVKEDSLILRAIAEGPDKFQFYSEKLGPVELSKVITLLATFWFTVATYACVFLKW